MERHPPDSDDDDLVGELVALEDWITRACLLLQTAALILIAIAAVLIATD